MGTSIKFGDYEPEIVPEPWEEYQYRDLSRAYYTQSLNMKIGKLNHCITVLTSLELNKCYTDSEKEEYISQAYRNCYLSALSIYIDNKGKIIKGDRVLTRFRLKFDINSSISFPLYVLDSSFKIKQQIEVCIDAKELHNNIIKNKQITFRNGKIYSLNKFHEYIVQASICNRRTDVNYTNLKVSANRDEINNTLNLLGIGLGTVGFLPGKATVIAEKGISIFALALTIEPRISLAEYTFPVKGPVYLDELTVIQKYKRLNINGYVSPQRLEGKSDFTKRDVLKELDECGVKIK